MFNFGDEVRVKINGKTGVVMGVVDLGYTKQYTVFHGPNNKPTYYEEQLELNIVNNSMIIDTDDFIKLYAYNKLNKNSASALFSLNSGKIKFIPFQFRPLNKILNSDYPRLLIADEVGVGKTIETGLIIKEFQRRDNAETIVIICPKDLTLKWQREMRNRFDEHFEILDSARLQYCLKELSIDGYWPMSMSKCIVNLEMIRSEKNIEALINNEEELSFDMLIVDEAHHVINTASNSHRVVEFFAEHSRMAVFLSATPLQLGSEDLFSLLNLLVPEEYPDFNVFSEMAKPNHFINAAIRHMRNYEGYESQFEAKKELQQIEVNNWARDRYHNNKQLNYWLNRLDNNIQLTNEERVSFIRDLETLHSFSNVINRTKRKDIGEFTIREPIAVMNKYTELEREFYEATTNFKKDILTLKYDSRTANFVMSTIERQITSCIPAFVMFLERFVNYGLNSLKEISDEDDNEVSFTEMNKLKAEAKYLLSLANDLPSVDNKAEKLKRIVDETIKTTNDKKLLVFSFFKNTLHYLRQQLETQNIRVEVITGDTSDELREDYRNRFRKDYKEEEAIDVLLCSEVGCEGLDYEFCSRMVNYDIPWNPMKIEQRIGRIDRFGQKSPKVQIFNFITEDTVEERIFYRCYERLGIFNSTVGDLEGVLGDMVSELSQIAVNNTLNEKQQIKRANQITDNAIRLVEEQRSFEQNSKELMLLDDFNNDSDMKERKEVQTMMLKNVVTNYLLNQYQDTQIEETSHNILKIRLFKKSKDLLFKEFMKLKQSRTIDLSSKEVIKFEKFLSSDKQLLMLNFGTQNDDNVEEFNISFKHPLVILTFNQKTNDNQISEVHLESDTTLLAKGSYLFSCFNWQKKGYKDFEDVITVLYDIENQRKVDISPVDLEKILLEATNNNIESSFDYLPIENIVYKMQMEEKYKMETMNTDIVNRKIATLNQYYQHHINKTKDIMKQSNNKKIIAMHQSHIDKTYIKWNLKVEELKEKLECDILVNKFAQGYLEVK